MGGRTLVLGQNGAQLEHRAEEGGDGLVVRQLVVGLCGTDLDIVRRSRPETVAVIGHEGCARVERAGGGLPFAVDDHIVFNPVNPLAPDEVLGHSTPGILQQTRVIEAAESYLPVLVPPEMDPLDAALVEPLATVVYGQSLVSAVVEGRCVAILGAGSIGVLHALHARLRGAEAVILLDRDPARLAWAVERGVVEPGETVLLGPGAVAAVLEIAGVRGVDAAYVCVARPGARAALDLAARMVRDLGCIDLVSGVPDGTTIPALPGVDLNAVRRSDTCGLPRTRPVTLVPTAYGTRVTLTGHRGTSEGHLVDAMRLLQSEAPRFRKVVTHAVALSELPELLARLAAPARSFAALPVAKILVDMRD